MIVKKTFSTLLMALPLMAAMTSCSDNDVAGNAGNSKSYIGFDVSTSRKTRGTVMDLTALQGKQQFTVYSYITDDKTWDQYVDAGAFNQTGKENPFSGQLIKYTDGKWGYAPLKLWPQAKNITFLSYWAGDTDEQTDLGVKVVTPSTPDNAPLTLKLNQYADASKQLDFLAAVSPNYTETENEGKVKIHFNHITTRLSFGAKLTKPIGDPTTTELQAYVTGVKLLSAKSKKLYTGATYTFGKQSKFENGVDGKKGGKWSYDGATAAAASIDTENILDKTTQNFGKFNQNGIKLDMTTTNAVDLFKSVGGKKQYLFLIPPADQDGITGTDDVVAQVTYCIASGSDANNANAQMNTYTADVALPKGALKAGVAYRINFSLNIDGNIIKIDPEVKVEDWVEDTEYTEAAQAIADGNTNDKILAAWNQLATQNAAPDSKYDFYFLTVKGTMPTELNLKTGGQNFKNGAIIQIKFTDGDGKLIGLKNANKLQLPDGCYLDETETDRNLIRKKEPVLVP